MIIDGHAHIYPENNADKIVRSFTDLHNMEPTASVGKGTIGDLYAKMQAAGTNYTVLANFAPVRSVDKVNEWTLSIADLLRRKRHPYNISLRRNIPCAYE